MKIPSEPSGTDWCVYIVRCNDGSLYTGITSDLETRINQHNGLIKGGSKYTRSKRPVDVVYTESFMTHKEAAVREYEIKQLPRAQKLELVKRNSNII